MNDNTCTTNVPSKPRAKAAQRQQLAHWAKALAHPARLQIIAYLAQQRSCVCGEVVSQIGLAQSTVSQHLKILVDSGLLAVSDQGPGRCYCVNAPLLAHVQQRIGELIQESA